MKGINLCVVVALILSASCAARDDAPAPVSPPAAELISVDKIWDGAPHNAFTDLVRFNDVWYCVFREGAGHVSPDGALRVITSTDGAEWKSTALMTSDSADLRDAKLTVTPDRRLMLSGAGALHDKTHGRHQSMVWFSEEGAQWTDGIAVADRNFWLWRVTWQAGRAWGVGYATDGSGFVRLYKSDDGRNYCTAVDRLFDEGSPNEATLRFLDDATALCLMRREKGTRTAVLGSAAPPYTEWTWLDLGKRLGGPNMIILPEGEIIAAGRLYEGAVRTALCKVDIEQGGLHEILTLPSGGDTSYPGLVWHDGFLWVSYYSSHERKAAIYLAKVRLDREKEGAKNAKNEKIDN